MIKTLQVFINNKWEYVFCSNAKFNFPIITNSQILAIKEDEKTLEDFKKSFVNFTFRISEITL